MVAYIKTLLDVLRAGDARALTLGSAPGESDGGRSPRGAQAFEKLECFKCHGQAGRGDGTSAPTLKDDCGPSRSAPPTSREAWLFNGGRTVEEIYARLRTGLDGTPMPSFSDAIESEGDHRRAALARRAVRAEPLARGAARGARGDSRQARDRALPAGPDDSAWARGRGVLRSAGRPDRAEPRWFAPTRGRRLGAGDARRAAARPAGEVDDPSKSPDPRGRNGWIGSARRSADDDTTALAHGPGPAACPVPAQTLR